MRPLVPSENLALFQFIFAVMLCNPPGRLVYQNATQELMAATLSSYCCATLWSNLQIATTDDNTNFSDPTGGLRDSRIPPEQDFDRIDASSPLGLLAERISCANQRDVCFSREEVVEVLRAVRLQLVDIANSDSV